ncbi:MAG: amidohydrolase family protein [Pseudomonadota bacterium]
MTAKQQIFDAHHHLWDLDHCRYPWLMARGVKRFFGDPTPIQKNYLPKDFLADAGEYDLVGSTHIQVGVAEADSVRETRWLQQLRDETAGGPPIPTAIVGFADLTNDEFAETISCHERGAAFRGVRQIIGRHPGEDAKTNSGALLDHPSFAQNLNHLAQIGASFDLQLTEYQYDRAAEVFASVPDLAVAICHFGSPWDQSADGFARWRAAMTRFAALPRMTFKFSGFGMFKANWAASDIAPYVEAALDLFGPERCMAGTNFPVDKLYGGYGRIWRALDDLIPDDAVRAKITRTNAMAFYRVSTTA